MRLLLLSDTHGDFSAAQRAVLSQPSAEVVLFMGDGCAEIEDLACLHPEKMFCAVRGNMDWNSDQPALRLETFEGVRILMLHGNGYGVGHGAPALRSLAKEHGAQIVAYGHTHAADVDYEDGVYYLNPGSARRPRDDTRPSYMTLDIRHNGILPSVVRFDH